MRLCIDGSVMEFNMEKSNQKELAKAKSGNGTIEVKADEKETKTGKTDNIEQNTNYQNN